jgi:hypothetical protein
MDSHTRLQKKRRVALSARSASGYPRRGHLDPLFLNMSLLRMRRADSSGKRGNVFVLALTLTAHTARPKRAMSFHRTRTLNE